MGKKRNLNINVAEQTQTKRQLLKELLDDGPISLRELAKELKTGINHAAHEMDHLSRSLNNTIQITPAYCHNCDYIFKKRSKWTKPSRCPKCRSEKLSDPLFFL